MPRLSRSPVEQKRMLYFISNLWNIITLIESRDEAVSFLKELLTPTEVRMLAKRIQIAKMLLQGYDYQAIRNFCRVTDRTISSVNNQLQFGDGGYQKIVDRLIKIELKKQEELEGKRSLFVTGPDPGRKTAQWLASKALQKGQIYLKRRAISKSLEK